MWPEPPHVRLHLTKTTRRGPLPPQSFQRFGASSDSGGGRGSDPRHSRAVRTGALAARRAISIMQPDSERSRSGGPGHAIRPVDEASGIALRGVLALTISAATVVAR